MHSETSQLIIYDKTGQTVQVRLEGETVWLTQRQMADLFDTSTDNIGLHLKNIFSQEELVEAATTEDLSVVQSEGKRIITRSIKHYNLDAIISVGYRVNSKRGVHFRQWATHVLRDHLVQGYSLNTQRLAEKGIAEARAAFDLAAKTLSQHALVTDEGAALLAVVQQYISSFRWLLAYDEDRLPNAPSKPLSAGVLTLEAAMYAIGVLRQTLAPLGEVSSLFGQGRGDALAGILGNIEQTMFGEPLYPSAQIRAAHLLYFVIKGHPFSDGNKRIGTLLFLDYLDRHDLLLKPDGSRRLADNAMVALALLVAESAPAQKEMMIRLILALMEG